MIAKFFPASVALVTAIAGSASAHDAAGCEGGDRAPAVRHAPTPVVYTPVGYPTGYRADYPAPPVHPGQRRNVQAQSAEERRELRHSDLNRDGRVTLDEAMQQGRREFRSSDRDRNRALTPREVTWKEVAEEDRDRNGWLSYGEHQDAIARSFSRYDTNRDGVLVSYELRQPGSRSGGRWR